METFMKTRKSIFGILTITCGLLLSSCGSRTDQATDSSSSKEEAQQKAEPEPPAQDAAVEYTMPTPDEAVKLALWSVRTKFSSFDVVKTNLTETVQDQTYSGQKRGGTAEDAADRRMFGAAYNAASAGDSFTRRETNWVCSLSIIHARPKPNNQVSTLVAVDMVGNSPKEGGLMLIAEAKLKKQYSDFTIVRKELYKVDRVVGGDIMKRVNTADGIGYVWNTEEMNKYYVKPVWVLVWEAGNLKPNQ